MEIKVLYIISSFNIYGGTPKKILDLMEFFGRNSALYVYHNTFPECKKYFENTGGKIYEGFFGRNILKHLIKLLLIIDRENINLIHTQFTMGETLGFLIKIFRPFVKVVITFEGSEEPSFIKRKSASFFYNYFDSFIFISNFVYKEKVKQFPILSRKKGQVIYNGTKRRKNDGTKVVEMKKDALLEISSLIELKNIKILIEAVNIIVNTRKKKNTFLYIAGFGQQYVNLLDLIIRYSLENHVFLLGYQSNIGKLLEDCDIFLHPSYAEGFGIAVAEAMQTGKPIIVSNAGALPELIENGKSGLTIDPNDAEKWADSIIFLLENPSIATMFSNEARIKAEGEFSYEKFTCTHHGLYRNLF